MRWTRAGLSATLLCCLALSCGQKGSAPGPPQAAATPAREEAPETAPQAGTFRGVLPCADCVGIRHTLVLRPDGVFFLRRTYLGKGSGEGESFDDIGTWAADGGTISLRSSLEGGRETPLKFATKGRDTLRKLDLEGRPIPPELDYDLNRVQGLETFEPRLVMRGMYSYMADAGLFTECRTGLRLPVAMEADNAALERAYSAAREGAGHPLLVSVEGRIARRPRMEGAGDQESLVVERFVSVSRGGSCEPPASLEGTRWTLVRLGDRPLTRALDRRAPHIQLNPEDRRLAGFAGCNRIAGGYELEGQKLRLGPLAMTKMACADGMELERAFAEALRSVAGWRILDGSLELLDAEGLLLARFEAPSRG